MPTLGKPLFPGMEPFKDSKEKPRDLMESTDKAVADKNRWCAWRSERDVKQEDVWVFSDGSSIGGYAAVVLHGNKITQVARFREPGSMRNVASELRGALLGLRFSPKGTRVYLVHDYIGVGAWCVGAWKTRKPKARALITKIQETIARRELDVRFIHHGGHQRDRSDFTRWNCVADRLCADANLIGTAGKNPKKPSYRPTTRAQKKLRKRRDAACKRDAS